MNKTIPLLLAAFSLTQCHAETIAGFCRQSGTLNIIPFTLDATTGLMTTFPAWTIGPDHAGHYSGSSADGVATTIVTGVQPTGTGATPEKLVSVDLNTGTITQSAAGLSNASFTGNSMTTRPGSSPWTVVVAQPGPGTATSPTTNVYEIDVAGGSVVPNSRLNIPYTGANAARSTVAHLYRELSPSSGNFGYLLQPCVGAPSVVAQQLVRVDFVSEEASTIDFNTPYPLCVDAPGLVFGENFGIANSPTQGFQLALFSPDDGTVNPISNFPSRWRRAAMSPYLYSYVTQRLYALNDAQNSMAVFNLSTFTSTTVAVTVAAPCTRGSITSFASVH